MALVLGSFVVTALYRTMEYQLSFYRQERALTERHDAMRVTSAVLASDLREANIVGGDARIAAPDSLIVRSPIGFGIVCAARDRLRVLTLFGVAGRLSNTLGDSLLVYHPDGWRTTRVRGTFRRFLRSFPCPYGDDPSAELLAFVSDDVAGTPVGAPVRAFRSYAYHSGESEGRTWLFRSDASGSELVTGPLVSDGSGLTFTYVDSIGRPTNRRDQARQIRVQAVIESSVAPHRLPDGARLRDTLTLALGGR